jgi:hypothetical protein
MSCDIDIMTATSTLARSSCWHVLAPVCAPGFVRVYFWDVICKKVDRVKRVNSCFLGPFNGLQCASV